MSCDAKAHRPRPDATENSARTSGMPAMTIAPKTTSRITSVTGTLSTVAPPRLCPSHSWNCASIDAGPTSSTRRPGWAAWTSATTACRAGTRASAVSGSPDIVARTRTAEPSSDVMGRWTADTSASAPSPADSSAAAAAGVGRVQGARAGREQRILDEGVDVPGIGGDACRDPRLAGVSGPSGRRAPLEEHRRVGADLTEAHRAVGRERAGVVVVHVQRDQRRDLAAARSARPRPCPPRRAARPGGRAPPRRPAPARRRPRPPRARP